jgi:transposase-like protein
MGLSRRQFTKEFKLTAVRRLEQGVSIAEVARALEVNPDVLHLFGIDVRIRDSQETLGTPVLKD